MTDKKKKKRTFGDIIRTFFMIAALCVFCYSGYQLITIYMEYKESSDEYKDLEDYVKIPVISQDTNAETGGEREVSPGNSVPKEDDLPFAEMESPVDFDGLRSINKDVIGWLNIEALDISYPIAKGTDNDFYLHNTIKKTYNFSGSIFMDYECKSDFSGKNTIIYGHNMKDGSMFGTLKQFREQDTFDKSPYFWIYTPTMNYRYKIFSCHEVGAVSNSYQISFADDKSLKKYIDDASEHSEIKTNITASAKDKIITLSTCTGNEATRFIVQGKMVNAVKVKK